MRQFYTVVLERMQTYSGEFQTEPYETAWAGEAMFFIKIHGLNGTKAVLNSRVQVSVDGIEWIDEGTSFPPIDSEGSYFIRVSHFGGWLRLASEIDGENARAKLTIQLALKE